MLNWLRVFFIVLNVRGAISFVHQHSHRRQTCMMTTRRTPEEERGGSLRFITNKMCPYAQRTWIALEESGTTYEMVEIPLYGAGGKPDWFMKLNPKGEVPVLAGGMAGSAIIGSEETVDHLMPIDATQLTAKTAQRWRRLINESLKPAGKSSVFSNGAKTELSRLETVLKDLDNELSVHPGPFVCGDYFTGADASAFPFLQRVQGEFGFPADCKGLEEWYKAASCRPSVKKTIQRNFWWWW